MNCPWCYTDGTRSPRLPQPNTLAPSKDPEATCNGGRNTTGWEKWLNSCVKFHWHSYYPLLWGEVKSISSAVTIFYDKQAQLNSWRWSQLIRGQAVLCNMCFHTFPRKRTHDFHQNCPETDVLSGWPWQCPLISLSIYISLLYKLLSRQQHLLLNFVFSELKLLLMNTASHFDMKRHITSGSMFSK